MPHCLRVAQQDEERGRDAAPAKGKCCSREEGGTNVSGGAGGKNNRWRAAQERGAGIYSHV